MITITREDDFVHEPQPSGVIYPSKKYPLSASRILYIFYDYEEKLINKFHY
jgi:hypothetical protein